MSKHVLWALAFVSAVVTAGNAPVVALRAGPSPIAAPSQAQTGAVQAGGSDAGAPQIPVSFTKLLGAYDAAIANGAIPDANGNVEITISGVNLTIDRKDAVVPR